MNMLHQYMPIQYKKVRDGKLKKDAKALLMSFVMDAADDYNRRCILYAADGRGLYLCWNRFPEHYDAKRADFIMMFF